LLAWEADLVAVSKSDYLTEIETKISMADWKADMSKSKFEHNQFGELVRRFFY
jgi:hypothetical protein